MRKVSRLVKDKIRLVLVEFLSKRTKTQIYDNINYFKKGEIHIEEDYTQEEINERRKLIPHLEEPKNKSYNAYLKFNKLIIIGKY